MPKSIRADFYSYVDFRELRMEPSDSPDFPNGAFSGYLNKLGYLDTHGTIMLKGCYTKAIPDFLTKGFALDSHGWATNLAPTSQSIIGYYVQAKEDDAGLWALGKFHSEKANPLAQNLRNQILERQEDGLSYGFSIGFRILDLEIIEPEDYEQMIPMYSKPEFAQQNLERAYTMSCVYLVKELELVEASLTPIPSNEISLVEEIRSLDAKFNKLSKEIYTMPKADAKRSMEDALDDMKRTLKRAQSSHDDLAQHLDDMEKHSKKLAKCMDDDDDEGEEKKPDGEDKKKEEEEEKRIAGIVSRVLSASKTPAKK